jgi:Fibronectin type III domain
MRAPGSALLYLVLFGLWAFSGCGGVSGMQPPPAPIFSSTPGVDASQGVLYSYQLAATDSSGGTVTFSLAVAPAGAMLSGDTLSWTPTAAQSRVANSFSVTATSTSGGVATQSWAVTPTGTITINLTSTLWTSTGPQAIHGVCNACAAVVPNEDGSYTVISGSNTAPGTVTIPNVPGGYYWLASGLNLTTVFDAFWTSSSTIDLGRDFADSPTPATTEQTTAFDFNIEGLDPTPTPSVVSISMPSVALSPAANATTVSGTASFTSNQDWSKVDTVFLTQYEPASLAPLNFLTLGPALTLTPPGYVNGATNTVTETLQPSPETSVNVSVPGSQWASMFSGNIAPSSAQVQGSSLSVTAEPFVTGRNESPDLVGPNVPLVTDPQLSLDSLQFPRDLCLGGSAFVLGVPALGEPAIVTDQDFGTLSYGDPFPSSWTRAVAFCEYATVPFPIPGSSIDLFLFELTSGVAVAPSSSPSLAPLAEPVQNPTVNGASLFTASTVNTTAITLSWSAPEGMAPAGYRVSLFTETATANTLTIVGAGSFFTAKDTVTVLPLTAGQTYIFTITTIVDAAANMETSPYRSALPTGFASVISAPVTISSGAMTPAVHGDAELLSKLFQQKGKPLQIGVAQHSH